MERTVAALVLRSRDAGESDRRLTLLTSEGEKIEAVARGARKPSSRLLAGAEPLTLARYQLAKGRAADIVKQVEPMGRYRRIRTDFDCLTAGLALAELVETSVPWGQSDPGAFVWMASALSHFESAPDPHAVFCYTAVQLMEHGGWRPVCSTFTGTGQPVQTASVFISPLAGGAIPPEDPQPDRFAIPYEVAIALDRLAALAEPPPRIKRVVEVIEVIYRLWGEQVERKLAAGDLYCKSIRESSLPPRGESEPCV